MKKGLAEQLNQAANGPTIFDDMQVRVAEFSEQYRYSGGVISWVFRDRNAFLATELINPNLKKDNSSK